MRHVTLLVAALVAVPAFANETSTLFGSRSWQFRTPAETAVAVDIERERQKVEERHYEKYTGIHGGTWGLTSTNIANMSVVTASNNGSGYVYVDSDQDIDDGATVTQDADAEQQFLNVDNDDSESPFTVNMLNGTLNQGGYE